MENERFGKALICSVKRIKAEFVPAGLFLWISGLFLLNGCADDSFFPDTECDRNVKALLSTRSVAVTVCSDAYVDVGGYSAYKGTTCRTFIGGGGAGGLGSGEYYPGGFPQNGTATDRGSGGGGNSFYVGDNWYFTFKNISPIYGYGSTLNLMEKSYLEAVFSIMKTMPQDFDKLVDMLVRRNLRIDFKIKPDLEVAAQYDGKTRAILFHDADAINWDHFREELIHAVQHLCYYGDSMTDKYKNYEFEAKVFIDMSHGIALFYDQLFYLVDYIPTFTDDRPLFSDEYRDWCIRIFEKGWIPGSEYAGFNSLCETWQGYKGTYLSTFVPKLLKDFFGKVRPPLKPDN